MHTPETLMARLDALGIATETTEHPPVYTVEEAKAHRGQMHGAHSKNLFLKDKKGAMFLVTALEDRAVDLKDLRARLDSKPLSFASAERLMRHLGVEPGSVTPFALINDDAGSVRFALDRGMLDHDALNFHPLVNTATTRIAPQDLLAFLDAIDHPPMLLDF